jgi:hypothetical protein
MIISASRRTDIPAFYAEWMASRIKAGYCTVFNPFNRDQVKYVSLRPEDAEVIVFWTRHARPFRDAIALLDERKLRYYFQYSLTHYSRELETRVPPFEILKAEYLKLAEKVGPDRIIWRYDPIVINIEYSFARHVELFGALASDLKRTSRRVVISLVDYYQKTLRNLAASANAGSRYDEHPEGKEAFGTFIRQLAGISREHGFVIQSCAEPLELAEFGVEHGKCIDDRFILDTFGIDVTNKKDQGQRKECGCVKSVDIGVYDTCLHGCQYCYATKNHSAARFNHDQHDPSSPSLLGWYNAQPPKRPEEDQLSLEL